MPRTRQTITHCPHIDRKHFAKGKCKSCYNHGGGTVASNAKLAHKRELYAERNRAARVYGDGVTRDADIDYITLASDPHDDLVRGSRYIRRDFLASLMMGSWPDGLIVKDKQGVKFIVRRLEGFNHSVLEREDGLAFQVIQSGQNYQLRKVINGKSN